MLKNESMVVVADNTGAKKAQIIRILKGSMATTASVGDFVVVAIKSVIPNSHVKKGQITKAIVVRVKKEVPRKDGTYIRFGDNAVVLMTKNEKGEISPIGKRIFGPVARELRDLGYKNITNMAEEVL
ncbi:MAG TPA: 50S ribosomal protein L14 [Candidatus Absconditabacterales bacterium]|nr:50S ribosomal protein L14 [Candidatus Absconditabacterales bacterium]HOQ79030.1 50S ribosomal protein L14 [Candidatus Absconditabacterales bacterium]HPK27632.1 50S ribosomal protein L14 [Candidatus Absconditabacterales bacterium]